jgi:hypothetical protein
MGFDLMPGELSLLLEYFELVLEIVLVIRGFDFELSVGKLNGGFLVLSNVGRDIFPDISFDV